MEGPGRMTNQIFCEKNAEYPLQSHPFVALKTTRKNRTANQRAADRPHLF